MRIIFIRHGKTAGNLEKRYIGRTDEPLCETGAAEIGLRDYPDCEIVISSPMKRCIQTAEMIYPGKNITVCNDLRECDFGDFEGRNYIELNGNIVYQKWIDSNGKMPFPNGESHEKFTDRCAAAFENMIGSFSEYSAISFVLHGGSIMAILEKYAVPKRGFYDYQVKNGCGFLTEFDGKKIMIAEEIR